MLKQVYRRDGKDYCLGVSWFRSIEEQERVTLALVVSQSSVNAVGVLQCKNLSETLTAHTGTLSFKRLSRGIGILNETVVATARPRRETRDRWILTLDDMDNLDRRYSRIVSLKGFFVACKCAEEGNDEGGNRQARSGMLSGLPFQKKCYDKRHELLLTLAKNRVENLNLVFLSPLYLEQDEVRYL